MDSGLGYGYGRLKRKGDDRLDLPCGYDPLPTTPSPSADDEIQDSRATPLISQDLDLSELRSVFRSRQVDWRRSINQYFSTVHVVSPQPPRIKTVLFQELSNNLSMISGFASLIKQRSKRHSTAL